MRISGWSSDVCSSDLRGDGLALQMAATLGKSLIFQLYHRGAGFFEAAHRAHHIQRIAETGVAVHDNRQLYPVGYARQGLLDFQIGRAPCRERVGQYVSFWLVDGSSKKTTKEHN